MDSNSSVPRGAPAGTVSLFVTALGLWMGAAAFFSGGVLPILFLNLEPSEAGRVAALVFPAYFRAGLVAGLVATLAAAAIARQGGRRWVVTAAVLAVMTLAQGWSALVLHPEMAAIRGVAGREARFQELHKRSVQLNGIVLAGGALVLLASGYLLASRRDDA